MGKLTLCEREGLRSVRVSVRMMYLPDSNAQSALPATQAFITSKRVPEGSLSSKLPSVIMKGIHFQHAVQKGVCGSHSQRTSLLGSSQDMSREKSTGMLESNSFWGGNLGSGSAPVCPFDGIL